MWTLTKMGINVAPGSRSEKWRNRTQTNRAGRKVNPVGILGARRVGLQTTELAQLREV